MSLCNLSPAALLTAAMVSVVPTYGHGRLQVPLTRKNVLAGFDAYENDPVNFGTQEKATTYKKFSCRNDPPKENGALLEPPTTVWAGDQMDVQWLTSADHVGDCAMYVSYDYDFEGDEVADMEWFKIANWKDCKSLEEQANEIDLPEWLPAGRAVFRWDWYALHVHPAIEFYAQCADVQINGHANSLEVSQVPKYSMMGLYPEKHNDPDFTQGWRNAFLNPTPTWMTGPPCACKTDPNNGCEFTKDAATTEGYISKPTITGITCGSSDESPVASPTPPPSAPVASPTPPPSAPVASPTPPPSSPVATPVAAPTPIPDNGDCVAAWGKCGGNGWNGATCCESGYYCHKQTEWYSQCEPVPSSPTPNPTPAPTPSPTSAPTESDSDSDGSSCVALWGKCGGSSHDGPTCCVEGAYCNYQDEWYSQCVPN